MTTQPLDKTKEKIQFHFLLITLKYYYFSGQILFNK